MADSNSNAIVLNLVPSLIMEAVKGETYIKGNVERSADDRATGVSYHEQAGDEVVHERKLLRTLYASLEDLKSYLSDYLSSSDQTSGNNVSSELKTDSDVLTITLEVSPRFNRSYTQSLAHLCAEFIENRMLVLWWTAINANQAALYQNLLNLNISAIKRCFVKTAPAVPNVTTTSTLEISVDGASRIATQSVDGEGEEVNGQARMAPSFNGVDLYVGEVSTITYTIDAECIDDIEADSANRNIVEVRRTGVGKFAIEGIHEGVTKIALYSHHDSEIKKDFYVRVRKDE